jgi:catechol 2,3-dioxygenase-like lactoylglutathione lyase family enzyme
MDQRLSFITIGVDDLESMSRFYKEQFGWTPLKRNGWNFLFPFEWIHIRIIPCRRVGERYWY